MGHLGVIRAARRKLEHELGIPPAQVPEASFTFITRVLYQAESDTVWGEHEVDHILVCRPPAAVTLALNDNEVCLCVCACERVRRVAGACGCAGDATRARGRTLGRVVCALPRVVGCNLHHHLLMPCVLLQRFVRVGACLGFRAGGGCAVDVPWGNRTLGGRVRRKVWCARPLFHSPCLLAFPLLSPLVAGWPVLHVLSYFCCPLPSGLLVGRWPCTHPRNARRRLSLSLPPPPPQHTHRGCAGTEKCPPGFASSATSCCPLGWTPWLQAPWRRWWRKTSSTATRSTGCEGPRPR